MAEQITKKVNAKNDFPGSELSTEFEFGANLDEMTELFGAETVYEMAIAKGVIVIQSELSKIATSKDADGNLIYPDGIVPEADIVEHFSNYKLAYKRGGASGKSEIQKLIDKMAKLPEEEAAKKKEELLRLLGM